MAGLSDWEWAWSKWGDNWEEAAAGCRRDGLPQDAAATSLRRDAAATDVHPTWDPFSYQRRKSALVEVNGVKLGGEETVRVFTSRRKYDQVAHKIAAMGDFVPEVVVEDAGVRAVDPRDAAAVAELNALPEPAVVTVADGIDLPVITAFRLLAAQTDPRHPILLKDVLVASADPGKDFLPTLLEASCHIGALICDGIGDAVLIQGEEAPGQSLRLAYNILQASGARIFKTDYVACPSCGRTLFNLQTTTQKIRAATGHLKGVRIAVMGCIVNGPGEMADADFGYVGGAPGKINLYVGKEAVKFNIPEGEAVERLIDLIRDHGKWTEPAGDQMEVIGS
ncbi:MAG: flavodoxin-dependent (E)-4-hydroxy-3-methylbut-2-enyl-diphosphate synthase [Akkermansiaceae bacterium]|nr:flavodoxin-dependent (E)-4-hydroxy-3-methylbut-2-enyl-diphosphate synthase [Akkermansiaceae bacterium]